ncbi:hypothetical protein SAMN00777080_1189 [Aquiflexum balticum DSM 16537]|uniref:Uncharacterized protein n=2 Tax=Aquiflexum TaxID=280472 RepID=A0A1W2H1Y7_9BACT|nr:hypothetical protein SAMN00777080_1189 [Aquiflexum balticum DSM 16537]
MDLMHHLVSRYHHMSFRFKYHHLFIFLLLFVSLTLNSCQDTLCGCESFENIYSNDFTKLDLENFENGRLFIFRGDTLLGNYHNEEVSVTIPGLPFHNTVRVTIELWIHDTWDGNVDDGFGGPDYWYMKVDESEVVRTTFSNSPCESTFCLRQSFPNDYFRQNLPKTDAFQTLIPGLCVFAALPNYTSKYRVTRLVKHEGSTLKLTLGDELMQTNVPDPKCDESWSVGKIELSTFVVR